MKNNRFASLLVCGLLIGLAATSAQAQSPMKVNVPFDFTIVDTHLAAGQYTIVQASPQANPRALMVRNQDGIVRALSMGIRLESLKVNEPKLVFRKYGNKYFLAEVWLSTGDAGTEIRKGSHERELAQTKTTAETVIVAALR